MNIRFTISLFLFHLRCANWWKYFPFKNEWMNAKQSKEKRDVINWWKTKIKAKFQSCTKYIHAQLVFLGENKIGIAIKEKKNSYLLCSFIQWVFINQHQEKLKSSRPPSNTKILSSTKLQWKTYCSEVNIIWQQKGCVFKLHSLNESLIDCIEIIAMNMKFKWNVGLSNKNKQTIMNDKW